MFYVIVAKTAAERAALLNVLAVTGKPVSIEYDGSSIFAYVSSEDVTDWHAAAAGLVATRHTRAAAALEARLADAQEDVLAFGAQPHVDNRGLQTLVRGRAV